METTGCLILPVVWHWAVWAGVLITIYLYEGVGVKVVIVWGLWFEGKEKEVEGILGKK